jgi:methyltransferase (TIGR00027 family)
MVTVADTAYSIAIVRADESKLPKEERLFDDPYAHLFAAAGEHAREATQRFLELQMMREGVRLRTRFIDDAVRDGLAAGLKQVVLLGAGFDARGMRMPEIAEHGASVFEVDFGYQLDRKREILSAGGVSVPERIAYVPVDFEAPDFDGELTSALEAKGFRVGAGAIFVWEGVIGYISMSTIEKTMAFVARTGGRGTRLVFVFGQFSFDPESAEIFAKKTGFSSCEEIGADQTWRRYWSTPPHEFASVSRFAVAIV